MTKNPQEHTLLLRRALVHISKRDKNRFRGQQGKASGVCIAFILLAMPLAFHARALAASNETYLLAADTQDLGRVKILVDEARRLQGQFDYDGAIKAWSEVIHVLEEKLGKEHILVANALSNLASIYSIQGNPQKGEPLLLRSLAIWEKQLGTEDPVVAQGLSSLGLLCQSQGQEIKAEKLYLRSLAIREKALGSDHPDIAKSLNQLAALYGSQGQSAKAESLLRRALAITEKESLQNVPQELAAILSNTASIYSSQARFEEAAALYKRSLSILTLALGEGHPLVAGVLNNLGEMHKTMGLHSEAASELDKALGIYLKIGGSDNLEVARVLSNMSVIYAHFGQFDKALFLATDSYRIRQKQLGAGNPLVARSMLSAAALFDGMGSAAEARQLYFKALQVFESSLGGDHPLVAESLANLGFLDISAGSYEAAKPKIQRAIDIGHSRLLRELPFLPNDARRFNVERDAAIWFAPFLVIDHTPSSLALALGTRLRRQGLLQEIEQRQVLLASAPAISHDKISQLRSLNAQLSSVSIAPELRSALREKRDRLEAELYRALPELKIEEVSTASLAKSLPAEGALIEFQRFQPFDGHKPVAQRWGEPRYLALMLKPDGSIQAVQLGPAAPIDAAVHQALAATVQNQTDAQAIWRQVSDRVLRPLLPHLSGSRQWFLSPDGELNRVPFAALPSPQHSEIPLAEAVQLRQLTTGRDLLRLQQPAPQGEKPLVLANPSYDRRGPSTPVVAQAGEEPVAQQRSSSLGSTTWAPLQATALEGQRVAQLVSGRLFSGPEATTVHLEQQQSPRILHIATHGFFLADPEIKPQDPLRLLQDQAPQLRGLQQEDPQLRSGLVLAGANQPDADPNDDGYLTAGEAVGLNLRGTELVVLSACNTAQGDVRTGEGVYGLQRSLAVAGARSTLLSLWKVDDAATLDFMTRFYKRLKAGEGRADALAATQKEFRAGIPGKPDSWKDPYYWAAWQLVGDWRPIQGQ